MIPPVMLWVDLTRCERNGSLPIASSALCRIYRVFGAQGLDEMIRSVQPCVLCFEFDYPPSTGLTMLSETKRNHPAVPILMLAEPHSEKLAIWALRARVWDYFVKPVCEVEIFCSVKPLLRQDGYQGWDRRARRNFITPEHHIPEPPPSLSLSRAERAILKAHAYLESRLQENISERIVAKYCGLSTSCFSRTFKRIRGVTFSGFVFQARVKKAMGLLEDKHVSVTEVCYQAGFQNLSHFSLTFRRHVGVSPTVYRDQLWERVIDPASGRASGDSSNIAS